MCMSLNVLSFGQGMPRLLSDLAVAILDLELLWLGQFFFRSTILAFIDGLC